MLNKSIYLFFLLLEVLFISCSWEKDLSLNDHDSDIIIDSPDREWLFLFYLNGDNFREGFALDLVNQLETLDISEDSIDILVLLDRSAIHSTEDGDWDETRIFHIENDINDNPNQIYSTSINIEYEEVDTPGELNMGNPSVLRNFIEYAIDTYPAQNTGLIIWGEGNGWELSYDDSNGDEGNISGDHLSIQELGMAFENLSLNCIFFDTENSSILESLYEIRAASDYIIAKESSEYTELNYQEIFEDFCSSDKSTQQFCSAVVRNYTNLNTIANEDRSISVMDTSFIENVNEALNELSQRMEQYIDSSSTQEEIQEFFKISVNKYISKDDDAFVDIKSMAMKIMELYDFADSEALVLSEALDDLLISHWSNEELDDNNGGIGLYLGHKDVSGEIGNPVVEEFIGDGSNSNKLSFVDNSDWNPDRVNEQGFLYVLWDKEF